MSKQLRICLTFHWDASDGVMSKPKVSIMFGFWTARLCSVIVRAVIFLTVGSEYCFVLGSLFHTLEWKDSLGLCVLPPKQSASKSFVHKSLYTSRTKFLLCSSKSIRTFMVECLGVGYIIPNFIKIGNKKNKIK